MSTTAAPAATLPGALEELRAAAERLEQGQGHSPLTDEADRLLAAGGADTVGVVVLGDGFQVAATAARLGDPGVQGGDLAWAADNTSALLAAMATRPTVLILAPGLEASSAADGEVLNLLAASAAGWATADPALADRIHGGVRLPPTPDGLPPELARAVAAAHLARQAVMLADFVQERQQGEVRQLQARQKREQQRTEAPGALSAQEAAARQTIDGLKGQAAEQLGQLGQTLRERGRRTSLRTGPVLSLMTELLANLGEADFDQDPVGKKIRLSLKPEVADDLRERFATALQEEIAGDCAEIARSAAAIPERLAPGLQRIGLGPEGIRATPVRLDQIWAPIEEGLHLQVKYRGEVQRRGFLQRLGEGRRVVFLVLMIGSLFGGFMGFNIRRAAILGPVFLLLFIGSVAFTFHSWSKEERVDYEDELIRLRDMLSMEFSRLLTEALRERQVRLQLFMEELRREVMSTLDGLHRELGAARTRELEAERKLGRARDRMVEQKVRELQGLGPPILKARQTLERFAADAARQLTALKRTPA